jgi:hypothetical protein
MFVSLHLLFSICGSLSAADIGGWQIRQRGLKDLVDVTYGNGLFVAVGDSDLGGAVALSTGDGQWKLVDPGTALPLRTVVFSKGMFIAFGEQNFTSGFSLENPNGISWRELVILTSSNGENWTVRFQETEIPPCSGGWPKLLIHDGRPVIFDHCGGTLTSENGSDWVKGTGITAATSVAAGNGFLLAFTDNGVQRSRDGLQWELSNIPAGSTAASSITFGNGVFVATVRGAFSVNVSADGVNWTRRPTPTTLGYPDSGLSFADGRFYCFTAALYGDAISSTDGAFWETQATTDAGPTAFRAVASGDGKLIAVGGGGVIATYSPNQAWQEEAWQFSSSVLNDVAASPRTIVAVGASLSRHPGEPDRLRGAPRVFHSQNGEDWLPSSPLPLAGGCNSVAYGLDQFIAVGRDYVIGSEDEGKTWLVRTNGPGLNLSRIVFARDRYVAVGSRGLVMTSADGLTWKTGESGVTGDIVDVVHGGGRFVAVGGQCFSCQPDEQVNFSLASQDGVNWEKRTLPKNLYSPSLAFGNGIFLLGALPTGLISTDGLTWKQSSSVTVSSVSFGRGRFLGRDPEPNALHTSVDGERWSLDVGFLRALPKIPSLARIRFTGDRFTLVGAGSQILQSGPVVPPFVISLSPRSASLSEQTEEEVSLTVTRTGNEPFTRELPVQLALGGTAESGVDFDPIPAEVVIPGGQTSARFTVRIRRDQQAEGAEDVTITVAPGDAYELGSFVVHSLASRFFRFRKSPRNDRSVSVHALRRWGGGFTSGWPESFSRSWVSANNLSKS